MSTRTSFRIGRLMSIVCMGTVLAMGTAPAVGIAEESDQPKSIRMTCGSCPDGYATTGVTQSKEMCKEQEDDPTLVECVPIGANLLAVCGSCPEGYAEIGGSSVPSRCGTKDGGRLTQCQLKKMDTSLPDPSQGMKSCPPDCGKTATPGQGAVPAPPKYQQLPEAK